MFGHWSLRARLTALALGATFIAAAIGGFALFGTMRVADGMGALYENRVKPLVQLDVAGRALERQRAAVLATLAATNDVMVAALEKQAAADAVEIPRMIASLRARARDADELTAIDRFSESLDASRESGLREVLRRLRNGQFIEADVAAQAQYLPQMDAASAALDGLIRMQVALAEREQEQALAIVRRQALITGAITLLGLAAGLALAAAVSRALHRALGAHEAELARGAMRFAQGELHHRIEVGTGASASVAASLNTMSEEFGAIVSGVAGGARRAAQAAQRLSGASQDLSQRTAQQAASLEQTAATMQQIAATVRDNHERAERARRLATDAAHVAEQGGKAVSDVVLTMNEIAESSRRVREIVAMIDGIAFQTNILSLNASVEAARAGEQGRGFGVVASEVRGLSLRSAEAARQIRALVEESARRADAGTQIAGTAGSTMRQMLAASRDVTGIVEEIAGASREQASAVTQVNRAIEQLEAVTQGNAALAERTADDARGMAAEAAALVQSVSRFTLGETVIAEPAQPAARLRLAKAA